MKRIREKAEAHSHTKPSRLRLFAPLLACMMVFLGCQGPPSAPSPGLVSLGAPDMRDLQTRAVQIITDALADPNPVVRVNAIEVVASTGQIRLMPKVLRLLADRFVPVRFAAALAIGDCEYALGKKFVARLLRHEDHNVVIAASYALAKLGSPEYAEIYHKTIESKDPTVRANSALLLGKTGDPNALKILHWALHDRDSDDKVVFQAAESIAMLGDATIYPKLWTMLISAHWDLRIVGIRAMGALKSRQAKAALTTMLKDDIPEVRLAAAEQLGKLNDPVGEREVLEIMEGRLIEKLSTAEARLRAYVLAAKAIGRICTPRLTRFLPKLLQSQAPFIRIAAAEAVLNCNARK
ncbi:MAG: HEAT repeat domain-containing protein [Phycisphaerales bacterium]|nr:MAG: HEAT repeat domain-containing protein [Phycisphaerales bacterium]